MLLSLVIQQLYAQAWRSKKDYPNLNGSPQSVSFVLNDEIYVLGGYFSVGFWKYTPSSDSWKNMGNLPFTLSHDYTAGSAFVINGKGYICAGEDGPDELNDTWEYDPTTKKWTKKSPYPGKGRIALICFVANNKAYLGGGSADLNSQTDFYEYDPAADTWAKKADCPQKGIYGLWSFVFSLNNKGYVSLRVENSSIKKDTYEYDPVSNKWTSKASFPGAERYGGISYVYNGKAYCGLGGELTTITKYKDMYAYDAKNDTWQKEGDFAGDERYYGTAAVVNNMVYIGAGAVNNSYPWTLLHDWWEYSLFPANVGTNDNDEKGINIYPIPANDRIYIRLSQEWDNKKIEYRLHNSLGSLVTEGILNNERTIEMAGYSCGIYIMTMSADGKTQNTIIHKK